MIAAAPFADPWRFQANVEVYVLVAFLIGAFHSVVMLQKEAVATTPFGILLIAISLIGSVIAIVSLYGLIWRSRQHQGRILIATTTESGVLELCVNPGPDWPGQERTHRLVLKPGS